MYKYKRRLMASSNKDSGGDKRYDLDVLTKEEKMIKKFPALTAKINKLENEIAKLKVEQVKLRGKK